MPQGTPPCGTDLKDPDLLYAGIVAVQSFLLDIQAVLHPHAVDIFDIIIKVIQALGTSNELCGHLAHIRANFVESSAVSSLLRIQQCGGRQTIVVLAVLVAPGIQRRNILVDFSFSKRIIGLGDQTLPVVFGEGTVQLAT